MNQLQAVKELLDHKLSLYYSDDFITNDPIQIPHQFTLKQDIEIAALLTATIAWGQRKTIINNGKKLMKLLDNTPFDFIMNHSNDDLKSLDSFVHRTFNHHDLVFFIKGLKHIYQKFGELEKLFSQHINAGFLHHSIHFFRKSMFEVPHESRSEKHISDPLNKSAAKRLHMFLRWMVRTCDRGIDFGLWTSISPSVLSCPLDVHTGNVARKLGLINRKTNDIVALNELDKALRLFDPLDPVKYDFALFGIGTNEKI